MHEYAIAWLGAKTTFYVDGQPVATLPSVSRAMYMMTNVWFPDWLDTPPAAGATGTLTVSRVTRPTP